MGKKFVMLGVSPKTRTKLRKIMKYGDTMDRTIMKAIKSLEKDIKGGK